MRHKNRKTTELRDITIERHFTKNAPGSVLISMGNTKVLCTATIEEKVPPFLKGQGKGWLTAEYSMLPGSTDTRVRRDVSKGHPSGRTSEIQRLIGRSLRSIIDLSLIGERSIFIDCDVLQADGGTRTTSITGGMVALCDAVEYMLKNGLVNQNPIQEMLAAVSIGIINNTSYLDLDFQEDSAASVDMNIVMTESGKFVEVQGTAENEPFDKSQLMDLLENAESGIRELIEIIQTTVNKPVL